MSIVILSSFFSSNGLNLLLNTLVRKVIRSVVSVCLFSTLTFELPYLCPGFFVCI